MPDQLTDGAFNLPRPKEQWFPSLALHHIGIVVHSIDTDGRLYSALGFEAATPIYFDPIQGVRVQFIHTGADVLVELVEPARPDSPVSNFLKKRGPGLHHLCYLVDEVHQACEHVRDHGGIVTCEPVPAVAFQARSIAFVYWYGSLIEFLERERTSQ